MQQAVSTSFREYVNMPEGTPITRAIWTALATVIDPELGLDVVTLGLVYDVSVEGDCVHITYTMTTPGCPMERIITQGIRSAVQRVDGISQVDTHVVWEPAWHPGMIAQGAFSR